MRQDAVEIFPGPDSYFDQESGVLRFSGGRVSQIISTRDNTERTQYMLEPELLTNLFNKNREKRRLVKFATIPKVLVNAVIAAEDKRFFQHAGFDPLRVIKAAYVDLKQRRNAEGASTLSMQVAGMLWLNRSERTWRRKAAEVLITLQMEQKLSKEEIFEFYANQIDLGRRGSFSIRGFGEGAQAYFGKDVRDLTLAEAALLAGLIQAPSRTNPIRWPDRARARRNVVLGMMRENGYITEQQYAEALSAPPRVAKSGAESADAPYFVDLVNDQLQDDFQDRDFQGRYYRVYTTLDMDLQREAAEAVRIGMEEVDKQLKRQRRFRNKAPDAQVALVALDAQTGELKADVGGRNYGLSQLNHLLAKRQPGSSFKPFVFAAAFETSLTDNRNPITSLTTLVDEPTTFWFDDKPYTPGNFKNEFLGAITLRQAISKSKNVPTVKLAEMIGYDKVVDLAKRAGMNLNIQPTPAVALGAYEVTPIEIAGAYTVFTNQGAYVKPNWVKLIRDEKGGILFSHKPTRREALDPRITYLMVDLLQEVMRSGTGAGVRSRGFVLPAAGKTGTSRDGWFAGFTSRLICIVWVGFDDNRELNLEGAASALPIWTEFMKRAHRHREYRNVSNFTPPDGIVMVKVDPATASLAAPACPNPRVEAFLAGTQPVDVCRLHGGSLAGTTLVAGWETPAEESAKPAGHDGQAGRRREGATRSTVHRPRPNPSRPKAHLQPRRKVSSGGFWMCSNRL